MSGYIALHDYMEPRVYSLQGGIVSMLLYTILYVTKYVHFNNEDFLELSNNENLIRKILLLTIGNFYEGSIDHIIMNYLSKT